MRRYVLWWKITTTFPWNLTVARFYFKTLSDAATIQGWLDFKGGIYRDQHERMYTVSIMSLFVCACTYVYPLPCSKISRAAFIGLSWLKYAVTFQGWWDFEVWWDFEEVLYNKSGAAGGEWSKPPACNIIIPYSGKLWRALNLANQSSECIDEFLIWRSRALPHSAIVYEINMLATALLK